MDVSQSAEHLRAWLFTIATRVVVDERRRPVVGEAPGEVAVEATLPPYAELEHLTDKLPPTERAAVVLRYGYDLSYVGYRRRARLERRGGTPGGIVRRPPTETKEDHLDRSRDP